MWITQALCASHIYSVCPLYTGGKALTATHEMECKVCTCMCYTCKCAGTIVCRCCPEGNRSYKSGVTNVSREQRNRNSLLLLVQTNCATSEHVRERTFHVYH
jgi:hypothetical protein